MASARLGLRVDVCTYHGLRRGLSPLLDALARRRIRVSVFSSMGPDRSGLAVLRLFRKRGFLSKMLRTRAASLYGIRTALYGTLLPAPGMAARCGDLLRRAAGEGHELGIHAWDHVRWQDGLDSLDDGEIRADYARAREACAEATGREPDCTAAPAWLSSGRSLAALEGLGLRFASDTRGRGPYIPLTDGRPSGPPQIPVTLPTLDEALGRTATSGEAFFDQTFRALVPDAPNVLAVHAEAEGRAHLRAFEAFLDRLAAGGWEVGPLGGLLPGAPSTLPVCPVERGFLPGRAGSVSIQGG